MVETEEGAGGSERDGRSRPPRHAVDRLQWGGLEDWVQLVRLPTVFTLLSNVLTAAILVESYLQPLTAMVPTLLAAICAYWAGMILNDVVDLEEDRQYRPQRPLVRGRISPAIAGHVANGLLLACPLLILGVTSLHSNVPLWQGAAFGSAVLLALCVRMYNSALKKTPLGPILMGGCRALNILMVGCTMLAVSGHEEFIWALLYFALGIFLYVMGVTVYASREESEGSPQALLGFGLLLEIAGVVVIALLPRWTAFPFQGWLDPARGYPLLVCLIGATVINRSAQGILHPVSRKVQLAVKHALLTLILLDAAVVWLWAGPWYGGFVLALLVPALLGALRGRTT